MKNMFLSIILFIAFSPISMSQTIVKVDSVSNEIVYSDIVVVNSVSKNDLYVNVKQWISSEFNSTKSVIDLDDRETGIIVLKPLIPIYANYMSTRYLSANISYVFTIYLKDGKYKYVANNFYHDFVPGSSIPGYGNCSNMLKPTNKLYKKEYDKILIAIDSNMRLIESSLKSYLDKSISGDNNNNW